MQNQNGYHKTTFQQTIQELRILNELTYANLSQLTGIEKEKLKEAEEGHSDNILLLSEYEAVCKAFGKDPFELVQGLNEQGPSISYLYLPQRISSVLFVSEM